jgi:hypothetical protein
MDAFKLKLIEQTLYSGSILSMEILSSMCIEFIKPKKYYYELPKLRNYSGRSKRICYILFTRVKAIKEQDKVIKDFICAMKSQIG